MTTQDQNTLSYAAGWYADTANPGSERYYDGTAWTQETRPTTATPPAKPKKKRKWPWIVAGVRHRPGRRDHRDQRLEHGW